MTQREFENLEIGQICSHSRCEGMYVELIEKDEKYGTMYKFRVIVQGSGRSFGPEYATYADWCGCYTLISSKKELKKLEEVKMIKDLSMV